MKAFSTETFVAFRSRRGGSNNWLRGMLHRPGAAARGRAKGARTPGVVFFHGFTGDRMESHWMFVRCARELAAEGIAALRFDFYGSGESDGDFREVTLRGEISDARVAVDFFRRLKGIDPERVGLLGISMGGAVAASLAAGVDARALVLWSALARTAHLRVLGEASVKPIPGGGGRVEYSAREISPRFMDDAVKVDPLKAIARFRNPTLIIHPEKDESVPLSHAEDLFLAAGAQIKEKIIIPGANHTYDSIPWEREVIARTIEWLGNYL